MYSSEFSMVCVCKAPGRPYMKGFVGRHLSIEMKHSGSCIKPKTNDKILNHHVGNVNCVCVSVYIFSNTFLVFSIGRENTLDMTLREK